jgi:hypothetical protein
MKPKIEGITPILNVSSIADSVAWFELLGWERTFTWNESGLIGEGKSAKLSNKSGPANFAGICSGETSIMLCLKGQGPSQVSLDNTKAQGVWMSWWLSTKGEVDIYYDLAVRSKMMILQVPQDEPWGVREFHLQHPDGHVFRVGSGLD